MTNLPVTITDTSDVENAITLLLNNTIFGVGNYPNPAVLTSTTLNGTTVPVRIYVGWPADDRLQSDINPLTGAGGVNISVFASEAKNTTRFQRDTVAVSNAPLTASLTVSGAFVTVSGTGSTTNNLGIAYGAVAGSYRPADGESSDSMAANLAATISGATAYGSVITVPATHAIIARVVSDATVLTETARQSQRFFINVWAPNTAIRDLVGGIVHGAMSRTINLPLPYELSTQSLISRGSANLQMDEKIGLYRRFMTYETEWPTVDMVITPAVLFVRPTVNNAIIAVE